MTQNGTVIVVGGGAAGLAAAIAAAECGDRVIVLERMDRIGKKLLATGNGRCNLMNTARPRYRGGIAFAEDVLGLCGAREQWQFWHDHGLALREEEDGRVYPATGQAATVLDTLRFTLERLGVEIRTGVRMKGLDRNAQGWRVLTEHDSIPCGRVIVASGGKAQSKLGSDGSGYALLAAQGHRLVQPRPALTQIETDTSLIRGLTGIRVRAEVTVLRGDHPLHSEQGELLFADYGVSGICAMQCARWAEPGSMLSVNLVPAAESVSSLTDDLRRRRLLWHDQPADRILCGLVLPRIADRVFEAADVAARGLCAAAIGDASLSRLAKTLTSFVLPVRGVRGFDSAQVTAGGISTEGFLPGTLESRHAAGLHAAGEVLDVDGDCGGFNLMFAFGSGILAGRNGRSEG